MNKIINFENDTSEANVVLITGDTGSGKSILMKEIIHECSFNPSNTIFVFDSEGEYENDLYITHDMNKIPMEVLANVILTSIENKYRVRFDFSKCENEKSVSFSKVIDIFNSLREDQDSVHLFIDSIGAFINGNSSDDFLEILIKSRKRFRSSYLISQRFRSLNKEIMTRCNLFLLGENKNPFDTEMKSKHLGVNRKYVLNCNRYEFIKYEGNYNNLPCKVKVNFGEK